MREEGFNSGRYLLATALTTNSNKTKQPQHPLTSHSSITHYLRRLAMLYSTLDSTIKKEIWYASFGDGNEEYVEPEELGRRDALLNAFENDIDNEIQSSADDDDDDETVEPTPQDVVVSLLNHEYKRHLEPEIERIAQMKANNEVVDAKERAIHLIEGFKEKVLRGDGRFLRLVDRTAKIYEEINEDEALNSEFLLLNIFFLRHTTNCF
jgi:hypothetical protein